MEPFGSFLASTIKKMFCLFWSFYGVSGIESGTKIFWTSSIEPGLLLSCNGKKKTNELQAGKWAKVYQENANQKKA